MDRGQRPILKVIDDPRKIPVVATIFDVAGGRFGKGSVGLMQHSALSDKPVRRTVSAQLERTVAEHSASARCTAFPQNMALRAYPAFGTAASEGD